MTIFFQIQMEYMKEFLKLPLGKYGQLTSYV